MIFHQVAISELEVKCMLDVYTGDVRLGFSQGPNCGLCFATRLSAGSISLDLIKIEIIR